MRTAARPAKALVFLMGFSWGLLGEGVLFVHRQVELADRVLSEEFVVVAFPGDGAKDWEGRLGRLPGVASVSRVSEEQALRSLAGRDPELARALADGPGVPESFELRLEEERLPRLAEWTAEAAAAEPRLGLSYQPTQAAAILQLRFYERMLGILGALAFAGLLAAAGVALRRPGRLALGSASAGAAGAALGAAAGLGLMAPLGHVSPLWAPPGWTGQLLVLLAGGLCGWSWGRAWPQQAAV